MKQCYSLFFFSALSLILSCILYHNITTPHPHHDIDSPGYEEKAQIFYNTNSFVTNPNAPPPIVQQPLGYPLFMGLIYKAFGTHNKFVIWLQILLFLLSGLLLFIAVQHICNTTIALLAHAFFSINIGYLVFAQFILAETLLLFFLILFLERFLYFVKTMSNWALYTSGLSLGISILIKPAALYYILSLLTILIPFVWLQQGKVSKKALTIVIFTCTFLLPIQGYQLYNYLIYNSPHFSALDKYNMYVWFWSKVATEEQAPETAEIKQKLFASEQDKRMQKISGNPLKPSSWKKLRRGFWKAVWSNPLPFITTWTREMIKTHLGLYTTNLKVLIEPNTRGGDVSFFHTKGSTLNRVQQYVTNGTNNPVIKSIGFFELLWNALKYFFACIALMWLLYRRKWFIFYFFFSYISYFTFVTGFDGCARYRTMFDFVLLILAAMGTYLFAAKLYDKNDAETQVFTTNL